MIARVCFYLSTAIALSGLGAAEARSQGFAGLGTTAEGFAIPTRGVSFDFPRDHGAHEEYRIEWWYLTANMTDAEGRDYGLQWTLFRTAFAPGADAGWSSPHIWLGHAALTTSDQHLVAEKLARGGVGQAGATAEPFEAWIDAWHMRATGAGIDQLSLAAGDADWGYDITLKATGPLVAHGDQGYSVKSPTGQASYYYSQPAYDLTGTLQLPEGAVDVTGTGWLDREWSSQPLAEDQSGWDWFSLGFEDGAKLMAFRLRDEDAGFRSGTWITAQGQATALGDDEIVLTPQRSALVAGREVPVTWRLQVPGRDVDVTVAALNPQSWMALSIPYWEGPVRVSGSHAGRGYLEMTGYE